MTSDSDPGAKGARHRRIDLPQRQPISANFRRQTHCAPKRTTRWNEGMSCRLLSRRRYEEESICEKRSYLCSVQHLPGVPHSHRAPLPVPIHPTIRQRTPPSPSRLRQPPPNRSRKVRPGRRIRPPAARPHRAPKGIRRRECNPIRTILSRVPIGRSRSQADDPWRQCPF